MIRLYQFPPGFGLPNASPFCMKVETWLRMAGLPFELDNRGLLMKAPKRKLPFIVDDGETIADSGFIIAHLSRKYRVELDAGLDAAQRAAATAFTRLFEEHLYWAVLYTRWFEPAGWALTRQVFFGGLPAPLRGIVPLLARRGMRRELWGHGMGRHRPEEIMALAIEDIDAVAGFLADKPYLLGERPASVDATAHAFLANLLWAPVDSAARRHAQTRPALEAYCHRMRDRYFTDAAATDD